MNEDENTFFVITDISELGNDEDELRGPFDRIKNKGIAIPLSMTNIQKNTSEFFADLSLIFESIETTFQEFELDEVEITAGVTGSGKLSLIGGTLEGSIQGGIKFTFKRSRSK